jgi:hypothetical protein
MAIQFAVDTQLKQKENLGRFLVLATQVSKAWSVLRNSSKV